TLPLRVVDAGGRVPSRIAARKRPSERLPERTKAVVTRTRGKLLPPVLELDATQRVRMPIAELRTGLAELRGLRSREPAGAVFVRGDPVEATSAPLDREDGLEPAMNVDAARLSLGPDRVGVTRTRVLDDVVERDRADAAQPEPADE